MEKNLKPIDCNKWIISNAAAVAAAPALNSQLTLYWHKRLLARSCKNTTTNMHFFLLFSFSLALLTRIHDLEAFTTHLWSSAGCNSIQRDMVLFFFSLLTSTNRVIHGTYKIKLSAVINLNLERKMFSYGVRKASWQASECNRGRKCTWRQKKLHR